MISRHFEIRAARFAVIPTLLIAFAMECPAQTIADIARKERERQKHLQSTVTVVSGVSGSTSIVASGTSAGSSSPVPAPSASAAAPAPTGPLDNQGRDEKYWRGVFQKARDDVKRAEDRVLVLDLRLKELNTQLLRESALYNREARLVPEIAAAQKELDNARQEVQIAQQRILELENDLRRAGGLPGWAR